MEVLCEDLCEVLCVCGVSLTFKKIEPWQGWVCVCMFVFACVCECVCVRSTVIVVCLIFVN